MRRTNPALGLAAAVCGASLALAATSSAMASPAPHRATATAGAVPSDPTSWAVWSDAGAC